MFDRADAEVPGPQPGLLFRALIANGRDFVSAPLRSTRRSGPSAPEFWRTASGWIALASLLVCFNPIGVRAGEALQAAQGAKPDFSLTDLAGRDVPLATQRGHIVLVHFFATWCEPCREELPALNCLIARTGTTPISVLAISVGEVEARVSRFMADVPVNFPVLLDRERAVAKSWDVYTLPTTYVLDEGLVAKLVVNGDFSWDTLAIDKLRALGVATQPQEAGPEQTKPTSARERGQDDFASP